MSKPEDMHPPVSDLEMENPFVDFSNTEIAFSHRSDWELKKAAFLFGLMNHERLVDLISSLGLLAVKLHLPFSRWMIKRTIYDQFVGGETLKECQRVVDKLESLDTLAILDYGAEAKTQTAELDNAAEKFKEAVTFAASNETVPVISIKVSALSKNELLEKIQRGEKLIGDETRYWQNVLRRLEDIVGTAAELGIKIFVDAEESWIQDTIDDLVEDLMQKHNRKGVIVYNTFQLYRHDKYDYLVSSFEKAEREGYYLGAKLVRGAYMEKERERAEKHGYRSPIQPDKAATDLDFNRAMEFCVRRHEKIASCAATHNVESCLLQVVLINKLKLPRNHPHLNFCQLYGMSDHLTFNLARNGYNVAKYVPFGSVPEVMPYLMRRAQENTAVKGEFNREYELIREELARRKTVKYKS